MTKKSVLYIAGEGHSGTTLLDIILGSGKDTFSAGELIFLQDKGVKNREYCACGSVVPECTVWSQVISEWDKVRRLSLDQYIVVRRELVSKKKVLTSKKLLRNPTDRIKDFLKDTESLYDIIFDTTGSRCIVDSSKAPGMIPILKELSFNVIVVHITRRFGDVLNSYKIHLEKDLKKGVEHEITPRKTSYVLMTWLSKNFLTAFYSKDMKYKKIYYENLIEDLEGEITKIMDCSDEYLDLLRNRGPLFPKHLVAGSTIRMKDEIYIAKKPMGTSYHRLKKKDIILAKCIDTFYMY